MYSNYNQQIYLSNYRDGLIRGLTVNSVVTCVAV